jgi:hypothetical protein
MSQVARSCACGGWITADPFRPPDIEHAVREHQRTTQHRQWYARQLIEGYFVTGEQLAALKRIK